MFCYDITTQSVTLLSDFCCNAFKSFFLFQTSNISLLIDSDHSFPRFKTVLLMHFFESRLAFGVNHLETKFDRFMMGVSISKTNMQSNFFYPFLQLVKWYLMYVTYRKVFKILLKLLEKNIIYNRFKHLEKEHSTCLNTLIEDLADTIFICAVTVIMRFL